MSGILHYMSQRIITSLITLLGITFLVFLLMQLLPGDPARVIAGLLASEAEIERIREDLGLNQPLPVRYAIFLSRLVQGDLGQSARTSRPVLREISTRLTATLKLALTGTIIGSFVGIMAGVLSATRRNTKLDYFVSIFSVMGVSMPVYWLGLLLIILFAVNLRWLPAAGADSLSSIIMPALTLAFFSMALVARMTRTSMLEVLEQDYIYTARAKGLGEKVVIYQHALRNAFIPIITVIGLQFGSLLGGAVLTESVFGWPGMGRLLVDSIFSRDFPMVQGLIFIYALLFILVNLLVDILYAYIDPRIQYDTRD